MLTCLDRPHRTRFDVDERILAVAGSSESMTTKKSSLPNSPLSAPLDALNSADSERCSSRKSESVFILSR